MPNNLYCDVKFFRGGVYIGTGQYGPVFEASASGATYECIYEDVTPNQPQDIALASSEQIGYNPPGTAANYVTAVATGVNHEYTIPAAPAVSWNGQASPGVSHLGGITYYTGSSISAKVLWAGSIPYESGLFTIGTNFLQQQSLSSAWSQTIVVTERSDYPWLGNVQWIPYTISGRGGDLVSGNLVIKNGWKGKVNVEWDGLVSGGYGADYNGANGKAGYVVHQAAYSDPNYQFGIVPNQNLTYWELKSGASTQDTPAQYYWSPLSNATGLAYHSGTNRTIGETSGLVSYAMKQSDGAYQDYANFAAIPKPAVWGLDFTTWTATIPSYLNIDIYEEVPGVYYPSGRPEQLCVSVISLGVQWTPGTTHAASGILTSCDLHEDLHQLTLAWIDSSGGLRVACNPTPDTTTSWTTPVILETAGVSNIGICYLTNHTLVCAYDLTASGTDSLKVRTTNKFSFGAASDWAALTTAVVTYPGWQSSGRAENDSYTFGYSTVGGIIFAQSQDDVGGLWTTSNVGDSVTGAGGAFLADGYGCLYSDATGAIYWITTELPQTWIGQPGINTTLTGIICGLVRTEHGILVALSWDATSKKCRAIKSYDRGATWTKDTADITQIPMLNSPPAMAGNQGKVYACWQVANVPASVVSVDGGISWA